MTRLPAALCVCLFLTPAVLAQSDAGLPGVPALPSDHDNEDTEDDEAPARFGRARIGRCVHRAGTGRDKDEQEHGKEARHGDRFPLPARRRKTRPQLVGRAPQKRLSRVTVVIVMTIVMPTPAFEKSRLLYPPGPITMRFVWLPNGSMNTQLAP